VSTAPSTTGLAERFAAELQSHPELLWRVQGLVAGSPAWVAAALLAPQDRPTLVVAPDTRTAERLCAELRIFVGEDDDTPHSARRVHLFPARETPPLEMISPSPDVESARMAALYELAFSRAPLVVTSPEAMLGRVAAPERVLEGTLSLAVGAELPLEDLCWRLEHLGYRRVGTVQEPGELAVRGGIVDLWPPGADNPCRVELFGDEIESLRHFDAVEQTSFARVDELVVLPSMAFAVDQLADPAVRRAVHMRCDDLGLPTSERKTLDACLAAGERFPGVELMAPFVGAASAWLGDYLPGDTLVAVVDPSATDAGLEAALAALAEAREAAMAAGSFFPDPASLYMDAAAVRDLLSRRPLVELDRTEALETSGEVGHRHWRLDVRANTAVTAARARVRSRRAEDGFAPMAEALAGERRDPAAPSGTPPRRRGAGRRPQRSEFRRSAGRRPQGGPRRPRPSARRLRDAR
jgi:transcription-repair coupling factor (superfamily II helicase)